MKKGYNNINNLIINIIYALIVNDGTDTFNKSIIDKIVDVFVLMFEENTQLLNTIDMPDTTVNGIVQSKYVDKVDLAGNIYLNMSFDEATKIITENEDLANIIYNIIYLLGYNNLINDKINVTSSFVIENPNKDYYLTEQDYTFYEEKIFTDGNIVELEEITEDNYKQKHINISDCTYTIIACIRDKKVISCIVRNLILDVDFISEKINDICTNKISYYKNVSGEKVYKLIVN